MASRGKYKKNAFTTVESNLTLTMYSLFMSQQEPQGSAHLLYIGALILKRKISRTIKYNVGNMMETVRDVYYMKNCH